MIRITVDQEPAVSALKRRERALRTAIRMSLSESVFELLRLIQQKLSGQVLTPRTGSLLNSAGANPVEETSGGWTGSVHVGGGLAQAYSSVHEYGGSAAYDIYPVRKKALAFIPNGAGISGVRKLYVQLGAKRGTLKPAKLAVARSLGLVVVKHVTHPPLKERSYARSSLQELKGDIIEKFYRNAAKAVKA